MGAGRNPNNNSELQLHYRTWQEPWLHSDLLPRARSAHYLPCAFVRGCSRVTDSQATSKCSAPADQEPTPCSVRNRPGNGGTALLGGVHNSESDLKLLSMFGCLTVLSHSHWRQYLPYPVPRNTPIDTDPCRVHCTSSTFHDFLLGPVYAIALSRFDLQ
jgi:hypothetical protein